MTGDRNYGEIVGTGKAQDLKQNTQLLAQGGGHFGDRGEETCKGTERAQIILVGRERVQKGKMICDNPVPLNSRCSDPRMVHLSKQLEIFDFSIFVYPYHAWCLGRFRSRFF